jgi:hypothetical protein
MASNLQIQDLIKKYFDAGGDSDYKIIHATDYPNQMPSDTEVIVMSRKDYDRLNKTK